MSQNFKIKIQEQSYDDLKKCVCVCERAIRSSSSISGGNRGGGGGGGGDGDSGKAVHRVNE